MSAIVLVPERIGALQRTLDALVAQGVRDRIELVFVSPVDRLDPPSLVEQFWGWQHVRIPRLDSSAAARAEGIRHARGPVVVLTEDHAFPIPGWAAALLSAHSEDWAAVGPALLNANPASAVSWANMAIDYGPWIHPARGGAAAYIAGHNASYKRDVLLRYGERLDALLESESVLHGDLQQRGERVGVAPAAIIRHENFSRLPPALVMKFNSGRSFAGNRAANWSIAKRALYTLGSPALPVIRTVRAMRDLRRAKATSSPVALGATLVALLTASAIGEFLGYSAGPGRSMQCLTQHEFERKAYLTPRDQTLMYRS